MKITLNESSFTDFDGQTLNDEVEKPLNLKRVIVRSLLAQQQRDQSTGEEKYKRYKLAGNISDASKDVELTAEEITLIKELIGKLFVPIVVGQAYDALEGIEEVKNQKANK